RHRLCRAGFRRPRSVRPGARQYPRQSVAAVGRANGPTSGAVGAGYPLRALEPSSSGRNRGLPRPWTGAAEASQAGRLEQHLAALDQMTRTCGPGYGRPGSFNWALWAQTNESCGKFEGTRVTGATVVNAFDLMANPCWPWSAGGRSG